MQIDTSWNYLLQIKHLATQHGNDPGFYFIEGEHIEFSTDFPSHSSFVVGQFIDNGHYIVGESGIVAKGNLHNSDLDHAFISLYLPFCFTHMIARARGYAFSVAHFAQSLDGKIATHTGHSQWIGNEENLRHAHRMRALCDGVVIGSQTLLRDKPRLTVRKVSGRNPAKIVLGSGEYDFESLWEDDGRIIQVASVGTVKTQGAELLDVESDLEGISCKKALTKLHEVGISSVYIEGGNYTSSRFMMEGAIDLLQLHIAPLIIGSGIDTFSLPQADLISEAIQFIDFEYHPMGNHIMFQGSPEIL